MYGPDILSYSFNIAFIYFSPLTLTYEHLTSNSYRGIVLCEISVLTKSEVLVSAHQLL